ncbi:phosphotransferase enzyme family protein [Tengunoibacter tsumagoiensis]|uniref:Aminoglycoside phosphotransferase domain-containing protein n=1 Tax=Tengunoibacter tsumagoiensis TaxID=2014871 RepID=A0A402A0R0_9CHLR|nr:phosphotransferase [Tengunoibacter tsumagoiensis]GCE12737.1 hypothetical protein KTT_25960 [Tengunoibacter tsumagoiensis]
MSDQFPSNHEQETEEELLDLNEVMHAFGVDEWKNLGPIEPVTQALSLRVELPGEQNYILRERPESLLGAQHQQLYLFQDFLRQAGIPLPEYKRTPQGEPFVLIGEDAFELQQWSMGEQFASASPRQLDWIASAGAMLGRIHQVSQRYAGEELRWPAEVHIGGIVQSYLQQVRVLADTYPVQAIAAALSGWVEQWERVLPASMIAIGGGKSLPELHIHGDYHPLNLRFTAFNVSSVTGWEAVRWEKRIFELAYSLFYFCALDWEPASSLTQPAVKRGFAPERAQRFLDAYAEFAPPPVKGETTLLTDAFLLIAPIATMNGPLEDLFYPQERQESEAVIDEMLERLEWATTLPSWLARVRTSLGDMWR